MKKIEFEVTEGMREAGSLADISDSGAEQFIAMIAHPSFRKQLRAYVAGEVRRLVADQHHTLDDPTATEAAFAAGHNACVTTTLANIAAYEKDQEDGQ